jgi:hypothetical protein
MTAIHSADVPLFDRIRQALNIPQTANPSAADLLSKIRRLQQALSRTVDELDDAISNSRARSIRGTGLPSGMTRIRRPCWITATC